MDEKAYCVLHNACVTLYWDIMRKDLSKDEVTMRLRHAIEESADITFEDAKDLLGRDN